MIILFYFLLHLEQKISQIVQFKYALFKLNYLMVSYFDKVDEMIYDNTYCNPAFDFPLADVVFKRMVEIIEKNRNKLVLIAMGALGKEDICIKLSEYF